MNYKSLKQVDHTVEELKVISKMFNDHYKAISFKVSKVIRNNDLADDLVSEIFCKASQKIRLYNKESGELSTWLYTIANNHIIDYLRSNANGLNLSTINVNGYVNDDGNESFDFVAPTSTNADEKINNSEILKTVDSAIEKLDVKYKRIAILYFKFEYSYDEISEILNLPLGSVKGMIFRTRQLLQENVKAIQMA